MGGFTSIQLKDCSQTNINVMNAMLKSFGVSKKYRFYSEQDVKEEWAYYQKHPERYPVHLFPLNIKTYEEFIQYWNTERLGETFVPKFGMLTFDCYFGRTSQRALNALGRFFIFAISDIKSVGGSFTTFAERGMNESQRKTAKDFRFL